MAVGKRKGAEKEEEEGRKVDSKRNTNVNNLLLQEVRGLPVEVLVVE